VGRGAWNGDPAATDPIHRLPAPQDGEGGEQTAPACRHDHRAGRATDESRRAPSWLRTGAGRADPHPVRRAAGTCRPASAIQTTWPISTRADESEEALLRHDGTRSDLLVRIAMSPTPAPPDSPGAG
jgi:hypothetical protein